MDIIEIIKSCFFGALAGGLAGIVMGTKGGLIKNIILGLLGGAVGNWIFSFFSISLPFPALVSSILVASIGACVVIFLGRLLFR